MSVIKKLARLSFVPKQMLLEYYPPFLFIGVKASHISNDKRKVTLRIPLRWYSKNLHGTMFGGFIAAVADPVPAIMCTELLPHVEVWTKKLEVDFLKPARSSIEMRVEITQQDLDTITAGLEAAGKIQHAFEFYFYDGAENKIAHAKNTVHFRQKKSQRT